MGQLMLTNKAEERTLNLPIDIFFNSLSQELGDAAIGIILTGTGSDGSRGIRAIKDQGGIVMVQDPKEAQFDGMPQSAINTGQVDYVLPLEKLAEELFYIVSQPTSGTQLERLVEKEEDIFLRILQLTRQYTSLDFTLYKRPTLIRRIARRMSIKKIDTPKEYLDFVKGNEPEAILLSREFLIGVTKFFRDAAAWKSLMENALRKRIKHKKSDNSIFKVWVTGCSTGEEVYTLAMLLDDELKRQDKKMQVKIFATDIQKESLEIATRGIYPERIGSDIPPAYLGTYFIRRGSQYQVTPYLRKMVIFSRHDILRDPPFSSMDLVTCRNLLIYLKQPLQDKVISTLHYALSLNGILFLGGSESIGNFSKGLASLDRKHKIFINKKAARIRKLDPLPPGGNLLSKPIPFHNRRNRLESHMSTSLNEALLDVFNVVGIYIDQNFDILHGVGETKHYMELPDSGFSTNLLQLVPSSLSIVLSTSVRKAASKGEVVFYEQYNFQREEEVEIINILVKPVRLDRTREVDYFLIIFVPKERFEYTQSDVLLDPDTSQHVMDLEKELKNTRENLQATIEEVETSNEELQATNEELMASNEEMQSTNEELQSVNEELYTVNSEYQEKLEEVSMLNAEIENLIESTQIGTVFLDRDMCIQKFTPAIQAQFRLKDSDIGRPLSDFLGNFENEGSHAILDEAQQVLHQATKSEVEIKNREGWFLRRITPYYTEGINITGVVITFIEISQLKEAYEELLKFESTVEKVKEGILWINLQGEVLYANAAVQHILSRSKAELLSSHLWEINLLPNKTQARKLLDQVKRNTSRLVDIELMKSDTEAVQLEVLYTYLGLEKEAYVVAIVRDISERKKLERERRRKEDLERINKELEQFTYIASHDLQEPLRTISNHTNLLLEEYYERFDEVGKKSLDFLGGATQRMSSLVKGLLDYSRIGKDAALSQVDTHKLLEQIEVDLGKVIEEKSATLAFEQLPIIQGVETGIRSVFQNLISNALKFSKEGKAPNIQVAYTENPSQYIFSVKDNGIGISAKHQDRIFRIFQRLHNEDIQGYGIGLAQCKRIVEMHGGKIWVKSRPGRGSTFYFSVPK